VCEHWTGLLGASLKVSNFSHTYNYFFNNFFFHSQFFTCAGYITLKQQCVPHTNTNTLAIIPTYGRVLSVIKKVLQELMKEYQGVGKSLQNLVEGQERIGAAIEQRWSSEGEDGKEESGDDDEGSKDSPGESQEKGTLLSISC